MKTHLKTPLKYLLLPLLASAPVPAQEAPHDHAGHDHAGHDHAGHDHKAPASGSARGGARANESNLDYLWRKSDEAFHKGDYERAVGLHRAIVALDPGDVQSWSVAAWLIWSMGRGEAAVAHIDRGLKANASSWEMWSEAAQHFDLQKIAPRSLEAYKRSVELQPAEADKSDAQMLRRRLAHSAERAGDLALSAQTWRELVRLFPDEAVNKNNLARVEAKARGDKPAPEA